MQRDMDTIQFESRRELEELLEVLSKCVTDDSSQTVRELYELLDVMHMEW